MFLWVPGNLEIGDGNRIEYTFQDERHTLSNANKSWGEMWVRINKKWEGKCFTFNPPEEISHRGIKNINIISRFPFDLDISFHGKNQATDSELNGISFIAMYRQYYIVEISVEVILNRNTKRMPCIGSSGNIDEIRNRVRDE